MTELFINIEYDENIDFGVGLISEICKSLNEVEDKENKWKTTIDDCFIMIYNRISPIVLISFDFYKIKFGKKKDEYDLLNSYCEYVKDTLLKLRNITANIHVMSNYINSELHKIDFANARFHHGSYDLSMKINEAREKLLNKRNEINSNIEPDVKEVYLFKGVIDKIKRAYNIDDDYIYGIELVEILNDYMLDNGTEGGEYVDVICSHCCSVYIGNNKFDDYVIINIFNEKTKWKRDEGTVLLLYNRINDVITFDNYDADATDYENELIFVHNKNDYFEAYEKHDNFYGYNGGCDDRYEYTRQTHPKVYKMVFHEIEESDDSSEKIEE